MIHVWNDYASWPAHDLNLFENGCFGDFISLVFTEDLSAQHMHFFLFVCLSVLFVHLFVCTMISLKLPS